MEILGRAGSLFPKGVREMLKQDVIVGILLGMSAVARK